MFICSEWFFSSSLFFFSFFFVNCTYYCHYEISKITENRFSSLVSRKHNNHCEHDSYNKQNINFPSYFFFGMYKKLVLRATLNLVHKRAIFIDFCWFVWELRRLFHWKAHKLKRGVQQCDLIPSIFFSQLKKAATANRKL